jgi:enoyl-CoA hydratase/carnithine racemase
MRRERAGAVEVLWLAPSRPGRGYIFEDWAYIGDVCARVRADPSVLALVLRAEGAGFTVGADVADLASHLEAGDGERYKATTRGAIRAVADLPIPTIAVVEGICLAGSTALVNACDLRIGSCEASFEFPPARLGLVYPRLSTELLVRAVGDAGAKLLLYSGRRVDATDALRLGLVQIVGSDVDDELQRLLADLALGSPASHRGHKVLLSGVAESEAGAVEQTGYASQRFAETTSAARSESPTDRHTGSTRPTGSARAENST